MFDKVKVYDDRNVNQKRKKENNDKENERQRGTLTIFIIFEAND